jgi:Cof subfamily protein (haloacid dehalogenase superfamily)
MSLPYELISLDLDLTLLDAHHRISPRNKAAVERCVALGARVVITSGRMYRCTWDYVTALGLTTPVIAYNGAFIKHAGTGEVLQHAQLDVATAQEIVGIGQARGINVNYYLDDNLYITETNPWAELYARRTGAPLNAVGDLRCFADRAPTKVLFVAAPEQIAALYEELAPRFSDRAYVTISNVEYLEFMPQGVDKGKSLAVVADYFGIPQAKTIAFGDANNDIPVLAWAGLGVAMANGKPDAKAAADRIAPSNDDDGVAQVLEELYGFAPANI